MHRIYLALCIGLSTLILIIVFQNIIQNTPAYILTGLISSGLLMFMCAIFGAGAGVCFLLYFLAKKAMMNEENETDM